MNLFYHSSIQEQLEQDLQEPIASLDRDGQLRTASNRRFFLKQGPASKTYACEAHGLEELRKAGVIAVAEVVSVGSQHILTTYIEPHSPQAGVFERFAEQLAHLHRFQASQYGFYEDNFIGASPQLNRPTAQEAEDWAEFFYHKRLRYQFQRAQQQNRVSSQLQRGFEQLSLRIGDILGACTEAPCLLHGDLWAGNFICDEQNRAVLIDPAVYYGQREADLAMTKLFGGFSPRFYEAYQANYPLAPDWQEREPIYLLYHLLNHLNLFGRSYLSAAEELVGRYL